jgi:cellobiose-specific phosphotransferase system component IIC
VVPTETKARAAILFGAVLAILNTLVAHALVSWSERRSTPAFFGAVLGGMVGRMAVMLAAVITGVLLLGLPRLPLVVSLLAYYTLFLVMELTVQHRHTRRTAVTR